MPEVIVTRPLPTPEAADALKDALVAVLGDKCFGFRSGRGVIRVDLADSATAEDQNTATQIVLNHDFSKRAAHQIARAERQQALRTMRAENKTRVKTDDNVALSKRIDWLEMELEHMRELLGLGDQ